MANLLAGYGKLRTYLTAAGFGVIGACVMSSGIAVVVNPDKHTLKTTGTVLSVEEIKSEKTITYTGDVSFSGGTIRGDFGSVAPKVGDTVDVYYNPQNLSDAVLKPIPKGFGYIMMIVGCCVAFIAVLVAYIFSQLSQTGQAVVGGVEGVSNLAGFIQRRSQ